MEDLMVCARCKLPGKKFYNVPTRVLKGFVEQVCKSCETLDKYEASRPKALKAAPIQPSQASV
jgi:hypothetical protein